MADEDMVYPDKSHPLTPGQIIKLGGLFVFDVKRSNSVIVEYEVSKYVWIDPCKNEMVRTEEYRNFNEYFIIIKDEGISYRIIPRFDKLNKIIYVPAIPSIYASSVRGGLFWFKVPASLYAKVLEMGDNIDKEYNECMEKSRRRPRESEAKIYIDISDESIKKIASYISESLSKTITELISTLLQYKEMEKTHKPVRLGEREIESLKSLSSIKRRLLEMSGVYIVDITDNIISVMCDKMVVDRVKEFLRDNGIKLININTLDNIAVVRGVLE